MRTFAIAIAALVLTAAGPVWATTPGSTPGSPCYGGGVCDPNTPKPPPNNNGGPTIDLPSLGGRGAFITQIGERNSATIDQAARGGDAFASVTQIGAGNRAGVAQRGTGSKHATLVQLGAGNSADVDQDGDANATLALGQLGERNAASVTQTARGRDNGALLLQAGSGNQMALMQDGGDNDAVLKQLGSGNAMTATQIGVDNQLVWLQIGDGLPDLNITQDGGMRALVTQTSGGK